MRQGSVGSERSAANWAMETIVVHMRAPSKKSSGVNGAARGRRRRMCQIVQARQRFMVSHRPTEGVEQDHAGAAMARDGEGDEEVTNSRARDFGGGG
jgi:hypothetical protein